MNASGNDLLLGLILACTLSAGAVCRADDGTHYTSKITSAIARKDYAEVYVTSVEMAKSSSQQIRESGYYRLADLYANGHYVQKDYAKALDYYSKASYSTYQIAELYFFGGPNLPRDYAKARTYYARVVGELDLNTNVLNNHALLRLGYLYKEGLGGPQDLQSARTMFSTCAERLRIPIPECMNQLGIFYELGLAGAADKGRAIRWYSQAADQGNESGKKNRERLARTLEAGL